MMTPRMAAWFLILTVTVLGGRWAQAEVNCDFSSIPAGGLSVDWSVIAGDWFLKESSSASDVGPARMRITVNQPNGNILTYAYNWTNGNECEKTNPVGYNTAGNKPVTVEVGSNPAFTVTKVFIPFGDNAGLAMFERISMMFGDLPQSLRIFTRSKSGQVPDLNLLSSLVSNYCPTFSTSDVVVVSGYNSALDCITN
ncbi:uncharacterized protein LOC143279366 [Babylonia areolata]|uniref:uncharacterized protein LOC143279366 n=1 Tax=Babylonia areolata TaxID=304850 RepID=UPI003FD135E2